MSLIKKILCLANSRKLNGRCVAGREFMNGEPSGWLRPVSARPSEEVSFDERCYKDGTEPEVLDIISVPVLSPRPKQHQTENWLLNPHYYWQKLGKAPWSDLQPFEEAAGPLWSNGHHTYNGINDKVPPALISTTNNSLRLIKTLSASLKVFAPGKAFGNHKRRIQANFHHYGDQYSLWVTDPRYENTYLSKPDGTYPLGESYLTISLGELNPTDDHYHKLVAAILERP